MDIAIAATLGALQGLDMGITLVVLILAPLGIVMIGMEIWTSRPRKKR